ncbi:MAG: chemotaxis-specific protein-glutamate methyltransferase CheB [Rhodocyclaceae bacterium]|nr:MAG: chemotaxis-specific protein-glutamate methyltransferase CheB [Rhodocyclaceae bacterium]
MTLDGKRIRVLVVEDSPVQRELQVHLINADPDLEVVGTATDGREAVEQVRLCRPDVVTMDFHMPHMDGAEATRIIMETQPLPIVVVSGSSARGEVAHTFRALDAGALVIIEKPAAPGSEAARKMVETIKLMAEVRVVRRWPQAGRAALPQSASPQQRPESAVGLVAIGASTGGPLALQTILAALPRDVLAPIAIVQHISPGFTEGFAEWLTDASDFPVRVAAQGERLEPGQGYVAPEERHMTVKADGRGGYRIELVGDELENGHRPSVSRFFRSVAEAAGPKAVGVILTGMGKDGAAELRTLREQGAVTIAQDRESSVVPGMPGEAIRLEAAAHILPPEQIGGFLAALVKRRNGFK